LSTSRWHAEKLKVILEAEKIGNRAAGRNYGVLESCVQDWRWKKEKLSSCIKNRRAFLSTEMIQMKGCDLAKEFTRFMRKNGLSIRHCTTISQCLPDAYEEKLLSFQKYVIQLRQQKTTIKNGIVYQVVL
uniref:Uncharacterized protein n=1 Tax=Erpetoichthys calabaricus TaxID=27687 RepID=A0A8C4TJD8_ERPCA